MRGSKRSPGLQPGALSQYPGLKAWATRACSLLVSGLWLAAAALPAAESTTLRGRAMGTTWEVQVVGSPPQGMQTADLKNGIAAELERLEAIFSTYRTTSEIARFNLAPAGDWIAVSSELAAATAQAAQLSERTAGAFDATVAPLLRLWGFGPVRRTGGVPTAAEITAARAQVGWRELETRESPPALRKIAAPREIDLSSVAKGYAADALGRWLANAGWSAHHVQLGGDLKVSGPGPSGPDWILGIETAAAATPGLAATLRLGEGGLSTSGNYRNTTVLGGRTYGHIIDPRTGRPVESALAAVSVVAPTAAESSGWATALFVLGSEAGARLAEELGLAALFQVRNPDLGSAGFALRPTSAWTRRFGR